MNYALYFLVLAEAAVAPVPAARDEAPLFTLEVRAVPRAAKAIAADGPRNGKGFEKRITELEGKALLDLVGTKVTIQLQKNVLWGKQKPFTGTDFALALLDGKIISQKKMVYHLQGAQECLVKTPKGDYRLGIYYRPVGYIVFPDGECYWFLFGEAK